MTGSKKPPPREAKPEAAPKSAVGLIAVAMRPDYPEALLFLGSLALESGDITAAAQYVEHLHAIRPEDPGARLLFATVQLLKGTEAKNAGNDTAAENLYRSGLDAAPDFGPLLLETGLVAVRHGRFANAASSFERYLRIEPADPRGYIALGKCLLATDRAAEARPVFERGLIAAKKAGAQAQIEERKRVLQ